jgi:hypothetical protein
MPIQSTLVASAANPLLTGVTGSRLFGFPYTDVITYVPTGIIAFRRNFVPMVH